MNMNELQRYEMFDGVAYVQPEPVDKGRYVTLQEATAVLNAKLEQAALLVQLVQTGTAAVEAAGQIRALKETA